MLDRGNLDTAEQVSCARYTRLTDDNRCHCRGRYRYRQAMNGCDGGCMKGRSITFLGGAAGDEWAQEQGREQGLGAAWRR